jgi:hypothetical protein
MSANDLVCERCGRPVPSLYVCHNLTPREQKKYQGRIWICMDCRKKARRNEKN